MIWLLMPHACALIGIPLEHASVRALGGDEMVRAVESRCGSRAGASLVNCAAASAEEARERYSTVQWLWRHDAAQMGGRDERLDLEPGLVSRANALDALREMRGWFQKRPGELFDVDDDLDMACSSGLREAFETKDGRRIDRLAAFPELEEARRRVAHAERALQTAAGEHKTFEYEKDRHVVSIERYKVSKKTATIRGVSRSGKTAYVEPEQLKGLADELEGARDRLLDVEATRLAELARDFAPCEPFLMMCLRAAAQVDSDVARALAGFEDLGGVVPQIGGPIDFQGARHPVLALAGDVRPCDFFAGPDEISILAGPNGGGKSTLLATVGLFAMLVRLGVPVPARSARIDFFDTILADFEGSAKRVFSRASTYEAHCLFATEALKNEDGLVLFDELGSGTDLLEGGALAHSLLEELRRGSVTVLAATHDPRLKTLGQGYAHWTFGLDGGEPTFELKRGAQPTQGFALAAARRCGLPEAVLDRAKGFLDDDDDDTVPTYDAPDDPPVVVVQEQKPQPEPHDERVLDEAKAATARVLAAAARLERRERELDALFRDLRSRPSLPPLTVVGDTIQAAKIAIKQSLNEKREALLAANGLKPLLDPPQPGASVVLVAFDAAATTIATTSAVVRDAPADKGRLTVTLGLSAVPTQDAQQLQVSVDDLATWAVPVFADGALTDDADAAYFSSRRRGGQRRRGRRR